MKLKVGDIVEFKKYEDMTDDERMMIDMDSFHSSGTVRKVFNNFDFFCLEGKSYAFNVKSIAGVISDVDVNKLNTEDKILAKVTVKGIFADGIRISSQIKTSDVVKILKRKEPERFIVKEDYYGMYVNGPGVLITDKRHAKIYNSRNEAYQEAANMHINSYDVIQYDD